MFQVCGRATATNHYLQVRDFWPSCARFQRVASNTDRFHTAMKQTPVTQIVLRTPPRQTSYCQTSDKQPLTIIMTLYRPTLCIYYKIVGTKTGVSLKTQIIEKLS